MRRRTALPALIVLLAGAGSARADVLLTPVGGGSFRAGDEVALTVRVDAPGLREFELYLLPAPGAAAVRLTRELPAGLREVVVRIPNLPSRAARLMVRAGGGEADGEHEERCVAVSAAFEIRAGHAFQRDLPRFGLGRSPASNPHRTAEWWVGPDAPDDTCPVDGLSGTTPARTRAASPRRFALAGGRTRPLVTSLDAVKQRAGGVPVATSATASPSPPLSATSSAPLRL